MSYKSFIEEEFKKNNWVPVADSFKDMEGDNVLIFTHDDPDGLTAGVILKKLVEEIGGKVTVKLPPTYELDEGLLDSELAKDDYDAVIVSDKGTMGYYDDYVGKVDKFIVIDHHPPIGEVK
jgi:single-stranded DNA-specific DHH superfamily exonuclease